MERGNGNGLLNGKVLFVAGVGPQMGKATALVAAREGARVVLAARREKTIKPVANAIREAGGEALALQCDLAIEDQITTAIDAAMGEFGRVDAVFYNAAAYDDAHDALDIDEELWQKTMAINFRGALSIARLVVPSMVENGGGAFVFNSLRSLHGRRGCPVGIRGYQGRLERAHAVRGVPLREARNPGKCHLAVCHWGRCRFSCVVHQLPRAIWHCRRDWRGSRLSVF